MTYPWHTNQWQQLWRSKNENRLPHALLLSGVVGIGKAKFADDFARALLCRASPDFYCKQCHSCRLMQDRVHPNVVLVEPDGEGHAIKVDQIRGIIDFMNQSSLHGDYRIAIISPAISMNANAANALLKTLE